jgi:hypothetical protein
MTVNFSLPIFGPKTNHSELFESKIFAVKLNGKSYVSGMFLPKLTLHFSRTNKTNNPKQ